MIDMKLGDVCGSGQRTGISARGKYRPPSPHIRSMSVTRKMGGGRGTRKFDLSRNRKSRSRGRSPKGKQASKKYDFTTYYCVPLASLHYDG